MDIAASRLFFALVLVTTSLCEAGATRRWDFDRTGFRESWSVAPAVGGSVMGGSLWLILSPKERDPEKLAAASYQLWADGAKRDIELLLSPPDLEIPASEVTQVRLRVVNLSSLTDFFLRWRTKEEGWGKTDVRNIVALMGDDSTPSQARRCTMKADVKEWQEITCYIDQRWAGTIEQIAILNPQNMARGNLWIDWIEFKKGLPEPIRERPDVTSKNIVPHIAIPTVSQAAFADAFKVLDECLISDVPIYGFNYPVMSPGGIYRKGGWWQMDSSVTVTAAQWVNQRFADNVMRGFSELQAANPDGRIDYQGMYGVRGQVADISMLPVWFEVAYDVARRTNDQALRVQIYESMRKYLQWWLSPVKRDGRTGLISGTFEETFPHMVPVTYGIYELRTVAPVDLNVAVAVGAARTAAIAERLGKREEADLHQHSFAALSRAINTYLWDKRSRAYYDYDIRQGQLRPGLSVSTFDPLRLGIAPQSRRRDLLKRLLDPEQFNWGRRFLTSWAMTDPAYIEEEGADSIKAWHGNIWTLRNMSVVRGLEEVGRPDLAADLNWATIRAFHGNYSEYVNPTSGIGYGAQRYGMSASQYISAILDHLFGVDFDRAENSLKITPHIPKTLYGSEIALENLILPTGTDTRLSLAILQTAVGAAKVTVRIVGPLPEGFVEIALPGSPKRLRIPMEDAISVKF